MPFVSGAKGVVPRWELAEGGQVPPEAVPGGLNGAEVLYVARTFHMGRMLPGMLDASNGVIHVCCDGAEYAHKNYEVLCGCTATWMSPKGRAIPDNALIAGKSEDGEDLYVGRVNHNGHVTMGKVQFSQGACYIPFEGKELRCEGFEVLVVI